MSEIATFQLRLTGGFADHHELEGYDGYTALAGAAFTLSLVTNYVETGEIRHKGDFTGRRAVRARPLAPGSVIADFGILLQNQPAVVFGIAAAGASASNLLYGLVNRVISRNIGAAGNPLNAKTAALLARKEGDVEALVAITEPSLMRAHEAIGNSAKKVEWIGGFDTMANLTPATKTYMRANVIDNTLMTADVTVSGFYANSGHGSVFDPTLGRNVPFQMKRELLKKYGPYFSWGLDQYTNETGRTVRIRFTRIMAMDGRVKRYVIGSAIETPS